MKNIKRAAKRVPALADLSDDVFADTLYGEFGDDDEGSLDLDDIFTADEHLSKITNDVVLDTFLDSIFNGGPDPLSNKPPAEQLIGMLRATVKAYEEEHAA